MGPLEQPYRSRAVPPGTHRYWSWLFAARAAREPLLGIYALLAEWRALMDPGTDAAVAQLKLAWWREELARLGNGSPLHPITRYLAAMTTVAATDWSPLTRSVEAAGAQVAGVPLERSDELESHAQALLGGPLLVAAQIGAGIAARTDTTASFDSIGGAASAARCIAALATAQYVADSRVDYAREARAGRVSFAVEELLAAGIDNADLAAATPPPRLARYLDRQRDRAAVYFTAAAAALTPAERPPLRHLLVLATLGASHLQVREGRRHPDFRLADLYNAWNAARRAAAAR